MSLSLALVWGLGKEEAICGQQFCWTPPCSRQAATPPSCLANASPDPRQISLSQLLVWGWCRGRELHRASHAPLAALSPVLVVSPHHPRASPLTQHSDGPWGGRAQLSINKEKLKHLPGWAAPCRVMRGPAGTRGELVEKGCKRWGAL